MTTYLQLYERYIDKFSEYYIVISEKIKNSVTMSTDYNIYIDHYNKQYNKYKEVVREYNRIFRSRQQATKDQFEKLRNDIYELNAEIIRCKRNTQLTFYICDNVE